MEHEKMARFIAERRKEKKLTQKELAEQLGVTDKAVSKWERGLSCPDIALLSPLASILGVTANEVLSGEQENALAVPDTIVETTLQYADTVTKRKTKNLRAAAVISLSALLLIGVLTCAICDLAVFGGLTWSWYVTGSSLFLWCAAMPAVLWGRRGVPVTLLVLSVLTVPLLFVIEGTAGLSGIIVPMGSRIAAVGIVFIWLLYFLFAKSRFGKFTRVGFVCLLYIPVDTAVGYIISRYVDQPPISVWDFLGYFIFLLAALALFAVGLLTKKK